MTARVIEGRYEVQQKLGEGGMGAVYRAVHTGTGRQVAVKEIITKDAELSETAIKRFMREARSAGTINTKHIVEIIDVGTDPETGRPYMVMELLDGEDVKQLSRRVGQVAPLTALAIAAQACNGLQKAHDEGVIHRDIKPANLFLNKRDADEITVKLLDFGVAKIKKEQLHEGGTQEMTRTGTLLGSPLYMAPEQARGMRDIDNRADLWSLGVVLYRLLAGRAPFQHCDTLGELIVSICSSPTPPLQDFAPWIAPEVAAVVHACLVVDRDRRFQDAAAMYEAIAALLPNGPRLTADMMIGLPVEQRDVIAPKFDTSRSGADYLSVGSDEGEPAERAVDTIDDGDPKLATTGATQPSLSSVTNARRWPWVLAVGAGALCGAYAVNAVLEGGPTEQAAPTATALSTKPTPPAEPTVEVAAIPTAAPVVKTAEPAASAEPAATAEPTAEPAPAPVKKVVRQVRAPKKKKKKKAPPPPPASGLDAFGGRK